MRQKSGSILLLVMWALWCAACATPPPPIPVVAPPVEPVVEVPQERAPPPVLWRVIGPHGVSYLFGTMHFGVSTEELPGEVLSAMDHSTVFVMESDPTTADSRKLADLMMLPRGPSLDEQLGPDIWARLMTLLGGQVDAGVARRLRPWVLEAALIKALMASEHTMDVELLEVARARPMTIEFLEEWAVQVEMLNGVSTSGSLVELVEDPDGFRERTAKMTKAYLEGDVGVLEEHVFDPEYTMDALFEVRNRSWLPRLEELLGRGNVFVAVGVGHLLGPDSVIVLLEREGYVVERVEAR